MSIEKLIEMRSMDSIQVAFNLLDRLAQEVQFKTDKSDEQVQQIVGPITDSDNMNLILSFPSDLIHNVIKAWSVCWKGKATDPSPKHVFEKFIGWQSLPSSAPCITVAYSMIIHAAAKSKDPELAEAILKHILESKDRTFPVVVPFNSVIDAWAKSGRPDAPTKAEAVLKQMLALRDAGWHEANPDVVSYTSVILAWANSNREEAPQRAEEILHEMTRHRDGDANLKPSTTIYSALIDARAKADEPERAEAVLRDLELDSTLELHPDVVAYCSVMKAWAQSGLPHAAERAQALFDEMTRKHKAGEQDLKPNTQTFGILITVWARSKSEDSATRAQSIFDDMMSQYRGGDADLKPSTVTYSALIDAWGKAGEPERAEAVLRDLESDSTLELHPDVAVYNSVMNAWTQSGLPHAAERAQALFDEMTRKHNAGEQDFKPNTKTFGTLITAWARSKCGDGASKAQSIFDDMMLRYRDGDADLKPNTVIYSALIDAWAKAGEPERAEAILRDLESDSTLELHPDVAVYNSVMNAWTQSGLPHAADRAQALFDEMTRKHKAGGNDLKPDLRTYMALIRAWGRSRRQDGGRKAQLIFDDMMSRYRNGGNAHLKPDIFVLNALMDAWAKAHEPEKVDNIFRGMELHAGVKPNAVSYYIVMNSWARFGRLNAEERLQSIWDEMTQKYEAGERELKPNLQTFQHFMETVAKYKRKGT